MAQNPVITFYEENMWKHYTLTKNKSDIIVFLDFDQMNVRLQYVCDQISVHALHFEL